MRNQKGLHSLRTVLESMNRYKTFYDSELISQLINVLIESNPKSTLTRIDASEVKYVMDHLKTCGVSLP